MLSEIRKREPDDVKIGEAAWDVIEAGQRVLVARIDMLVLEARQAALSVQRQAVMYLLAVVLLGTAWVAFNFTAVLAMREYVSWVVAGGVTTAVNALIGCALLAWAGR